MDNELYDYRKYDQIWQRVNPQENPYPEARGSAAASAVSGTPVTPMYQTLLKEELRHMQEVLRALENALA